jgi:hypothetical protein
VNVDQIISEFRNEMRHLAGDGAVLEQLPFVTRVAILGGEINWITAHQLDAGHADAVILAEREHILASGKQFEWKVYSFDEPPDLLDRLVNMGFEAGEQEALVVYDLNNGLKPFEAHYPCEVRRIERVEHLADLRFVAETVFEHEYSRTVDDLTEALQTGRKGHDAYVAYVDGQPVSVGRLYTDPNSKFAGLYGGGTLPEFRSRGIYRAVTAARARDAVAAGSRYLQVDALPTSLPILLRLGFVHVADTWPCSLRSL